MRFFLGISHAIRVAGGFFMTEVKTAASFSSLTREHDELDRLLDAHQRALIYRNVDAAVAGINAFRSALHRHIEFENERLLPIYGDKGAETPGGTLEIFLAEHRKLRADASRLTRTTESLYTSRDL